MHKLKPAGFGFVLFIALRPQTLKHVRGGWSYHTDYSEPVDGNGAQNMVSPIRVSNQGPGYWPNALTNCANWAQAGDVGKPLQE
jgi:hypothetical protein